MIEEIVDINHQKVKTVEIILQIIVYIQRVKQINQIDLKITVLKIDIIIIEEIIIK